MSLVNKKEVKAVLSLSFLIPLFLIVFSGFVSALSQICDPSDDPAIQGVEIGGACYGCGDVDEICPPDYGADCGSIEDSDCKTVFWADQTGFVTINSTSTTKNNFSGDFVNTRVTLILERTRLNDGVDVTFEIYENDSFNDDSIITGNNALTATIISGRASVSWTINETHVISAYSNFNDEENSLSGGFNMEDFEFYFVVSEVGGSQLDTSGELILTVIEEDCSSVSFCSDYTDQTSCNNDAVTCSVASGDPECEPGEICECWWDTTKESTGEPPCGYSDSPILDPICGNNIIEAGETCDGIDSGSFTYNNDGCTAFGLNRWGGALACNAPGTANECHFDLSACGGITSGGSCGDGNLNPNEECEVGTWESTFTCSSFDQFTRGDPISCDSCLFNTTSCRGGTAQLKPGSCRHNEDISDDCSDNLLSYSWGGDWVWNSAGLQTDPLDPDYVLDERDGLWYYDPTGGYADCTGGSDVLPCPAQIKLPFFGIYNIIGVLVIIALIYYVFFLRKGGKKRKKKRK